MRDAARQPADRLQLLGVAQLHLQLAQRFAGALALHPVPDGPHQGPRVDVALREAVLSAAVDRLQSLLLVHVPTDDENRQMRRGRMHCVDRREPLAVGKKQVQQHGIERCRGQSLKGVVEPLRVGQLEETTVLAPQHLLHQKGVDCVVFHEQDTRRGTLLVGLDSCH